MEDNEPDRKSVRNMGLKWHIRPDGLNFYRAFHPKAAEHTVFSNAHGTFSRIDHMLGYKTSLGKFKKTEILSAKKHASISTKASFQTTTLEINYKKKNCKKHKHVETKQYATKQPMDH